MLDYQKYINIFTITDELLSNYKLDILNNSSNKLKNNLEDFKVKVLFVGGFNAGKSALINSLLDRDILTENNIAETAIATELMYAEEEAAILYGQDGSEINCSIDQIGHYTAKNFSKFVFNLQNNILKQLNDYLIVDMPGFDSGIEEHNRALMQYIDQGVVYIFLIDCEKGVISDSAISFLSEIRNYSKSVGFVLTKTEKKIPKDVQEIKANIEASINNILGITPEFIVTSKFDSDAAIKVFDLIKSFNPQNMLEVKFDPEFRIFIEQICQSLEIIRNSIDFNPYEIDQMITLREKAKLSLQNSLFKEKENLHNRLQNSIKSNILNDLRTTLALQAETLALVLQGNKDFNLAVNNIIRPVLISSIDKHISIAFDEFVENLLVNESHGIDSLELTGKVSTIFDKLKVISSKADSYNGMYKSILTALAVTTTVVAPWLELILIFLPDIIKLFSGTMQLTQLNEIKNTIQNEIIPKILSKLEPEIASSLLEIETKMLVEIEENFNQLIGVELEALENLKNTKIENLTMLKSSQSLVDSHIIDLKQLAANLTN